MIEEQTKLEKELYKVLCEEVSKQFPEIKQFSLRVSIIEVV